MDSSENWLLVGDVMIGYGKQWLEKGRVMQQTTLTPEGKGMVHGHRGRRTLPHVVCSYIQRKVLKYISPTSINEECGVCGQVSAHSTLLFFCLTPTNTC
ncbi:MAG: hypothetical protein MSS89_00505 [Prevotella sp.]|nr:hypothetical protein [Prevotella sp.]